MFRRNPRGSALDTLVVGGVLIGGGLLAYHWITTNPSKVKNFVSGEPTYLPNGTANPKAAPWDGDTGYSTSRY